MQDVALSTLVYILCKIVRLAYARLFRLRSAFSYLFSLSKYFEVCPFILGFIL